MGRVRKNKDAIYIILEEGTKGPLLESIKKFNEETGITKGRAKVSLTDVVLLGMHIVGRALPGTPISIEGVSKELVGKFTKKK